jgi:cardiolipin synthase
MMRDNTWLPFVLFAADLAIRVALSIRVIMRRYAVGVSLAWLALILSFPFVGAIAYLFFGELRLGSERGRRAAALHGAYAAWLGDLENRSGVDWSDRGEVCRPLARLAEEAIGIPAQPGNALRVLDETGSVFDALIADIDAARRTCHLEFYIWHDGGRANEVLDALIRAARRGVVCRVLLDAVGSKAFLAGEGPKRLRDVGVHLTAALPVSLVRMLFVRFDLRLHRKIVVIDGEVGYTGSMNLVDPRYFKQDAHVGQWIDAMARLTGPAVEALAITFLEDWELETGEGVGRLRESSDVHRLESVGTAAVQVLPSGPAVRPEAIRAILLMAIYAARRELVLTSPYFVPDESILIALTSAALRGVAVTIVVPARVDSKLVRLASAAFQGDLAEVGVRVLLFEGGLLHTKSVTIDGQASLFGSLNLDPRSLRLNFEITLGIYDAAITADLRRLQQSYIDRAKPLDLEAWRDRSLPTRLAQNAARLVGPLL